MEMLLNRNIKEVLREFPRLEQVLGEFSIGCATCGLGSCLLKDIVEVHNLSESDEALLMKKIAEVAYPGQVVEIPKIIRTAVPTSKDKKLSPPLRELVDEHTVIKKLIAGIPALAGRMDMKNESGRGLAGRCLDFIRNFADAFHHAKEENILFGYFDKGSEIINSFIEEHKTGRGYVKAAAEGIAAQDSGVVKQNLMAYGALLTEHIKKEDEILYPWMNRILTDSQVGNLSSKFSAVNNDFAEVAAAGRSFVEELGKT